MLIKRFFLLVFLLLRNFIRAEIKLPALLSSNMVLQRNSEVKLWGWADPNEKFKVITSWTSDTLDIQTDSDGSWLFYLKTTNSQENHYIRLFSKSQDMVLENVVFGEVWLFSGQSNMWHPLKGYPGQPTFHAMEKIARAKNKDIRLFTAEKIGSAIPLYDLQEFRSWEEANPKSVNEFSAIAYFFGSQLQELLDVPVGLIHASWGGTEIEAWMSQEGLEATKLIDMDSVNLNVEPKVAPTMLFNAMINPLLNFRIKGICWYQGEANRLSPKNYKTFMPKMVEDWRKLWEGGDFAFYFAQIAPFIYGGNDHYTDFKNSAFMREAQLECLELIPNSGIAITADLGEEKSIHPPKKKEVADRLLYNALNLSYGFQIDHLGPILKEFEIQNDQIILKFENSENGLFAFGELENFEIAGEDKIFYPAKAKIIDRMNVSVVSENVKNPKAVRYGWQNWFRGTLYDTNLLPASSFRTDNWDDATRSEWGK